MTGGVLSRNRGKIPPLYLPKHPVQAFGRGTIDKGNKQGMYQHPFGDSGLV